MRKQNSLTCVGIMLSLYTGMRIGEVCALTWDDVDLQELTIQIRHTVARIRADQTGRGEKTQLIIDTPKTSASRRDVPISSLLRTLLEQVRPASGAGYVLSGNEAFVSPRTFSSRYHSVLRSAGIPSFNFHILRHTFATRCIEAGMDAKTLSEILGHASVSITLHTYVHSSMDTKRFHLEKICTPFP